MQSIKAALAYWGAIFALGVVLGTVRTLWLAPGSGETGGQALAMGAMAFVLLMASEAVLAISLGQSLAQWLGAMTRIPGALGLAGQAVFAIMPVWAVRRS